MTPALLCLACAWIAAASEDFPRVPAAKTLFETSFERVQNGLPPGWRRYSKDGVVEVTAAAARTGARSLHLADASRAAAAGLRGPRIPVKPGQRLWVSGWYFSTKPGAASIYVECWTQKGRRISGGVKSFAASSRGQWRETRGRLIAPPKTAYATVLLYCWTGGVCDGYFDDIAFGTGFRPPFDRTPRPPARVQHPCGPYSKADIARARENIRKHAWAKRLLDGFKRSSQIWMRMSDADIRAWLSPLTPFRVVNCPNCGASWAICWSTLSGGRFRCRRCGMVFPNPKFPETKTEILLTPTGKLIPHPYYEDAKGRKYRLSGLLRQNRVNYLSRLGAMGRVYALTGDQAYARQALKVLRRLAEVYPDWVPHDWRHIYTDYHNTQSGKMSGWKLADCCAMMELALCYDLIYDSGALTDADKKAIENNVFREFGEFLLPIPPRGCCINDGPYQMSAMAYVGALLGEHRFIRWAVEPPGGFKEFIRRYFFRDGHWEDGSPSYEAMALSRFYLLPEILQGYSDPPGYAGPDRYDHLDLLSDPILKKALIAPLYVMFPDRTLPPINDSTKGCGYSARNAEANYFWYPTERNLKILNWVYRGKLDESGSEYSLFRRDPNKPLAAAGQLCLNDRSLLQPGLGWAILRRGAGADRTDLVLDYGAPCGWHGHPDRLNYLLWANGREVVTDLGYLGARHPLRPWMAHGACHNLVMVDGLDQKRKAGKLILFQPGERVQAVVAEAPDTYPQCTRYERALLLLAPAAGVQYVVDVFRVEGGKQHDFCFHGDGAVFRCPSLARARPLSGPLGPKGGGYLWFKNPRALDVKGDVLADWRFGEQDPAASRVGVRLRLLDASGRLIVAKAPNLRSLRTPFAKVELDYVIQRRPGPRNTFVAVVEPVRGEPVVAAASRLPAQNAGDAAWPAAAVKVTHPAGADYILVADNAASRTRVAAAPGLDIELRGRLGVVSCDAAGRVRGLWMADAAALQCGEWKLETAPAFRGKILDFDPKAYAFTVDAKLPPGRALAGQTLIAQKRYDGAYTVDRVEPARNGSRVFLRNEPILTVERGEEFRLPTFACLEREIVHSGAVHRFSGAPFAQATLPEHRRQAWLLRPGAARWTPAAVRGAVRLPALGGRLLLTDARIDPADTAAPRLESIAPKPRRRENGAYDLGYLRGRALTLTFRETSGPAATTAWLTGERAGARPVRIRISNPAPGRSAARLEFDSLPADRFRLRVRAVDALGNTALAVLAFQTVGFETRFTEMKIVASSGRLSKPLPSLRTQFYRAVKPGDFVTYEFTAPETGRYDVEATFTRAPSYGRWRFFIDGRPVGEADGYAAKVEPLAGRVRLGDTRLTRGAHRLRVEVVGRGPKATNCFIGLGRLILRPE